ncbi:hypothetical protein EDD11_002642 [Mortierella claussenii]|nr:hypothetical protein EDD11_002642 [Mortierella claussenii]
METDHANRPPPLPSKLRWRPYANGSSKKNSAKVKKEGQAHAGGIDGQGPNIKAAAHRMRGQQYYSGKKKSAGIKLQWEEAETIESMSQGGHQQNQHHPSVYDRSRDSSPSTTSVTSDNTSVGTPAGQGARGDAYPAPATFVGDVNNISSSNTTSSNPFANAMKRAIASLPSPPPSSAQLPITNLELVGGPSDFAQYRASVPDLVQNGTHVSTAVPSDTAYQIALTALLQSQNARAPQNLFHTPAVFGGIHATNGAQAPSTNSDGINNVNKSTNHNSLAPVPIPVSSPVSANIGVSATSMAPVSSASVFLGSSNINNLLLSDPDRVLSSQELLGVASIDELLTSCGFTDNSSNTGNGNNTLLGNQVLASPANSEQSFYSSPMNALLDHSSNASITSRAATPSSGSFSPMALSSTAFEALLAQPMIPQTSMRRQQQQPQQPQQQLRQMSNNSTSAVSSSDAYSALMQELSAPFGYISSGTDGALHNAPTAWPSLFPGSTDERQAPVVTAVPQPASQRSEIATQTDGPYEPPTPISTKASSLDGSPLSSLGLTDEELDPDWLSFLDEASPLFNEMEMPQAPPPSNQNNSNTPQRDRTLWNWAEQLLKPGTMTPNVSHNGYPSMGPTMTGGVVNGGIPNGSIGNGGLVRTLQGSHQQKRLMVGDPTERAGVKSKHQGSQAQSQNEGHAAENEKQDKVGGHKEKERVHNKPPLETSLVKNKDEDMLSVAKKHEGFGGLISILKALWIGGDNEGGDKGK